jgi:hypothetical protein
VQRTLTTLLALVLAASLSGCLGAIVQTPSSQGRPITTTHIHLLAAPFRIDAHVCEKGVAQVATFIPLWGVAVGILTFGIVVPKTTVYHCVQGS